MTREHPCCKTVWPWLRGAPLDDPHWKGNREAHGARVLAPLTGQDSSALAAFVHVIELYARSDARGRVAALRAAAALLFAPQEKTWPLFKEAIAHVLDWSDRARLWGEIEKLCEASKFETIQQVDPTWGAE